MKLALKTALWWPSVLKKIRTQIHSISPGNPGFHPPPPFTCTQKPPPPASAPGPLQHNNSDIFNSKQICSPKWELICSKSNEKCPKFSAWWLNESPSEKYARITWTISPGIGMKIKNIWNHLVFEFSVNRIYFFPQVHVKTVPSASANHVRTTAAHWRSTNQYHPAALALSALLPSWKSPKTKLRNI